LIAIPHIYDASFIIAENLKFITSIVSENTRGQGTPLKIVKTSISDVKINVFKIGRKCINFKSISIIPENLTKIEPCISEKLRSQNLQEKIIIIIIIITRAKLVAKQRLGLPSDFEMDKKLD
jgi:predicted GNAT family acetyltransferase